MLRARCFDICITHNAPPPLPQFSPRTISGSVGNRAVPARKFPLEGSDFWHLKGPTFSTKSLFSLVELVELSCSTRIVRALELAQLNSTQQGWSDS